jgi:hypothetical protein
MVFSTVLTLFLVPVAYILLDAARERLRSRHEALAPVRAEGP